MTRPDFLAQYFRKFERWITEGLWPQLNDRETNIWILSNILWAMSIFFIAMFFVMIRLGPKKPIQYGWTAVVGALALLISRITWFRSYGVNYPFLTTVTFLLLFFAMLYTSSIILAGEVELLRLHVRVLWLKWKSNSKDAE